MRAESKTEVTAEERFAHVKSSVVKSARAVLELYNLLLDFNYSRESLDISKNSTFNLYRVALSYMISNEYCKIFDKKHSKNSPKLSSIYVLIQELELLKNKKYRQLLSTLEINNDINREIKHLRDKTYAHADLDPVNKAFHIPVLNMEQVIEVHTNLKKVNNIANALSKVLAEENNVIPEYTLVYDLRENQTFNFINHTAKTVKYYKDNIQDAARRGY